MTSPAFLKNKQILVLGLGATGLSCARFLTNHNLEFVVNDSRANPPGVARLKAINDTAQLILGEWDKKAIANADVIIASPGVDANMSVIQDNRQPHCELIGDVEIFCRLSKSKHIAVTGSNGKSTVVSLLSHIADACNISSKLAGNIGLPVLDILSDNQDADSEFVILELSSFQLETTDSLTAASATCLNVCDDHLDRHKTIFNYSKIKQKVYQNSQCNVINRHDDLAKADTTKANDISFGLDAPSSNNFGIDDYQGSRYIFFGDEPLVACNRLPVVGKHNELNCMAALALGYAVGWPLTAMVYALGSFEGLEHRCKQVPSVDDITWVNDSKATNIGATLAAIEGLANAHHQLILIAGGDGKGANFAELKPAMAQVDYLITLGKDGDQIAALKRDSKRVRDLKEAVKVSRELAQKGDMVLLSPACASIDMFENYMQRGDQFIQAIRGGF
ncbi:UDP-N-acetylmuramoyl-L-alanine--D-glutamate ligase [Thalassotalea crassostreae]|uniref:UDP-N-acetylmuramoyl-L-alanine--D-glutamate ligase n=1 Tax=Thalassotalea crassostreae TaxID=1763536 RepID=UPI0008387EF8|nr:UDP-N-acetylmuramoyl-L-alanine--D-glutamate ligase [Thalassotalea crassostreae]